MNRFTAAFFISLILLAACNNKKRMIVGTWNVVKWEFPSKDSFFANTQRFIDTMGKGHSDADNIGLYGVANVDSLRNVLQRQQDSTKDAVEKTAKKAVFTFQKDGSVQLDLDGAVNDGKWLFDNDGALIIEEKGFGNPEGVSKYKVLDLTEKQLILRLYNESDSSTLTLEHEGK